MSRFAAQRLNMVEAQVRPNDVTDPRIHQAMLEIARAILLCRRNCVSSPIWRVASIWAAAGALLDARCFSKLAQLAEIGTGDVVLDVGCGSGYTSAVLARLAAKIVALEEDPALIKFATSALRGISNVELVRGRLADGFASLAPYNVIFVSGAVETHPERFWISWLSADASFASCARVGRVTPAFLVKGESGISDRDAFDAQVPTLPGFAKISGFVF